MSVISSGDLGSGSQKMLELYRWAAEETACSGSAVAISQLSRPYKNGNGHDVCDFIMRRDNPTLHQGGELKVLFNEKLGLFFLTQAEMTARTGNAEKVQKVVLDFLKPPGTQSGYRIDHLGRLVI